MNKTMSSKTGPAAKPPLVPDTLTVVLIDDTPNYIAIVHENEWRPYGRRTVQIRLTNEQRRQIAPRKTGMIQRRAHPRTRPAGVARTGDRTAARGSGVTECRPAAGRTPRRLPPHSHQQTPR